MKQTSVEWLESEMLKPNLSMRDILEQAKEIEKQQKGYSEEELLAFGKSCFYKGFEKSEKDDANCFTAFREEIGSLIEQFKKKIKKMENYKLLQEETSFFTPNGKQIKSSKDENLSQVHLCIDTGDKKDCAILLLNSKFDFIEVIQTTSNASKKDLKDFYINNRSELEKEILAFLEEL